MAEVSPRRRRKRAQQREHYYANSEEKKAYSRKWSKKNKKKRKVYRDTHKDKMKDMILKKLYGVSIDTYNDMFQKQEGRCAICERHQSEFRRALCVDHDHKTEEIRGLLCLNCNRALGIFRDSIKRLNNAIKYLQGAYRGNVRVS